MGCDRVEDIRQCRGSISIHASRMGCDLPSRLACTQHGDFNPRIPYGMRLMVASTLPGRSDFNPRIPYGMRPTCASRPIRPGNFNPRIPYGMRHATNLSSIPPNNFNPRIPYGMRLREWTLHSIIWKLLPALRADYIADIPEHLSVCIFGL